MISLEAHRRGCREIRAVVVVASGVVETWMDSR